MALPSAGCSRYLQDILIVKKVDILLIEANNARYTTMGSIVPQEEELLCLPHDFQIFHKTTIQVKTCQ